MQPLLYGTRKNSQRVSERKDVEQEEYTAQHRLIVLNKPRNAPTFYNLYGQSNIDVTIATKAIVKSIKNWKVHPHLINSDHNLITFEIVYPITNQEIHTELSNRFNVKGADWGA